MITKIDVKRSNSLYFDETKKMNTHKRKKNASNGPTLALEPIQFSLKCSANLRISELNVIKTEAPQRNHYTGIEYWETEAIHHSSRILFSSNYSFHLNS